MEQDYVEAPPTDSGEEDDKDDDFEGDGWISLMQELNRFQEICLEEVAKLQRESPAEILNPSRLCPYGPVPSFSIVLQRVVGKFFPDIAKKNTSEIMDAKIRMLEEQITKFKIDINNFQAGKNLKASDLKTKIVELKNRNLELENRFSSTDQENQQLKQEISRMKQLEVELKAFKKRNEELEKQVVYLEERKWKLQSDSDISRVDSNRADSNSKYVQEGGKFSSCIYITNPEKFIASERFATFLPYNEEKLVWLSFKKEKRILICGRCGKPRHVKSKCRQATMGGNNLDSLGFNLFVQDKTQTQESTIKQATLRRSFNPQMESQNQNVQSDLTDQSSEIKGMELMVEELVNQESVLQGRHMSTCDSSTDSSTICSCTSQKVTYDGLNNLGEVAKPTTFAFIAKCREQKASILPKHTKRNGENHFSNGVSRKTVTRGRNNIRKKSPKQVGHVRQRKLKPRCLNIQLRKRSSSCELGSTFLLNTRGKKKVKLE